MKLSIINDWLKGCISSAAIRAIIAPYLEEYLKKMNIKGTSIPLFLTEDISLSFGVSEFDFFCNSFLKGDLNELELSYIAELLLLSSFVVISNEKVQEGLDFLCDIDIYRTFTKDEVKAILINVQNKIL
jgi:hypothetical protein